MPPTARSRHYSGHAKLAPVGEDGIEFNVVFKLRYDYCLETEREGLPPVETVRSSLSLEPLLDETFLSYLPDGMYQLKTEKETMRIQRVGPSWDLVEVTR